MTNVGRQPNRLVNLSSFSSILKNRAKKKETPRGPIGQKKKKKKTRINFQHAIVKQEKKKCFLAY